MGQKEDFEKDMAKVAEDPETQRWWKVSRCFRFLWVEKRRLNRSS
jgi:L-rhamnose mutarotase